MTLRDYLSEKLKCRADTFTAGFLLSLREQIPKESSLFALTVLDARYKERQREEITDVVQSEDFTLYDVPTCPSEDQVAKIAGEYYAQFGFYKNKELEEKYKDLCCPIYFFSHPDGRTININITSSPVINPKTKDDKGVISVTSNVYHN